MRDRLRFAVCLCLAFSLGWLTCMQSQAPSDAIVSTSEVYFSPKGGARAAILEAVGNAENEVLLALYYFTDADMAEALIEANRRGVAISVLLDKSQRRSRNSQAKRLSDAGVMVAFDSRHRILHHKFAVIDEKILVTGSQNWTKSAETANAENTLVITDNPLLAQRFRQEFLRLRAFADTQNRPIEP